MSVKSLQALLSRLGEAYGIPALQMDDDGYCLVRVDDRIDLAIEFHEDSQSLQLSARCGTLPEENRAGILQELLDANFLWSGTGGAMLATNSREGALYLQYREPIARLDQQRLADLLHAIVANAEAWHGRLAELAIEREPGENTVMLVRGQHLRA